LPTNRLLLGIPYLPFVELLPNGSMRNIFSKTDSRSGVSDEMVLSPIAMYNSPSRSNAKLFTLCVLVGSRTRRISRLPPEKVAAEMSYAVHSINTLS